MTKSVFGDELLKIKKEKLMKVLINTQAAIKGQFCQTDLMDNLLKYLLVI